MLTRRQMTQTALIGAGALAAGSLAACSEPAMSFDRNSPEQRLLALAKLRGSAKKEPVIWWLDGTLYGVVDQVPTPMWHMETVSFASWEKTESGEYLMSHRELSLRKDFDTGELLEEIENPYTGELLKSEHKPFIPAPLLLSANAARLPEGVNMPATFIHDIQVPTIAGNDIWIGEDMYAEIPAFAPGAKPWRANDINTYHGALDQVLDPGVTSADATMVYQGMYSWRPWLNMGDIEGQHVARMAGKKLRSIDDIPESYLNSAALIDPEFVETGIAALGF